MLDLSDSRVDADLIDVGMLFQHRGLATEKARSLKQIFRLLDGSSPQSTVELPWLTMYMVNRLIVDNPSRLLLSHCSCPLMFLVPWTMNNMLTISSG